MSAIPWVLLGLGAFGLAWARDLGRKQRASARWPHVMGRLRVVRPRELSGNFDDDLLIPFVQYEYRVGGEVYVASEIDFSGRTSVEPEAFDRTMAGLERGAEVTVYYDPANPARSVLRPGAAEGEEPAHTWSSAVLMLGCGLVVLVVELASGLPFFDAVRAWLG